MEELHTEADNKNNPEESKEAPPPRAQLPPTATPRPPGSESHMISRFPAVNRRASHFARPRTLFPGIGFVGTIILRKSSRHAPLRNLAALHVRGGILRH